MLATHGTAEGLSAHGHVVTPKTLAAGLRYADSLLLLHFSACLVMQEGEASAFIKALHEGAHYPISGYRTSVDWGGSAVAEFTYLDLVLSKGLSPAAAAERLVDLVAFAGDTAPEGSPYAPLGFHIVLPREGNGPR
jgi:hypothetical protein